MQLSWYRAIQVTVGTRCKVKGLNRGDRLFLVDWTLFGWYFTMINVNLMLSPNVLLIFADGSRGS